MTNNSIAHVVIESQGPSSLAHLPFVKVITRNLGMRPPGLSRVRLTAMRGDAALAAGRLDDALRAFQDALTMAPSPVLHTRISVQVCRVIRKTVRCYRELRQQRAYV